MYTRLSETEKQRLRSQYEHDPAYMAVYGTIDWVSHDMDDLSPEEIWSEALRIMDEIRITPCREWKVRTVSNTLERKFEAFRTEDGQIHNRTNIQRQHSTMLVLYVVVWMMIMEKKTDNIEEHPYTPYIQTILPQINNSILFDAMLDKTSLDEELLEKERGCELSPKDYLGTCHNAQTKIKSPLLKLTTNEEQGVVDYLQRAANIPKNKKSRYQGPNRNTLSAALMALESSGHLMSIITNYDDILQWLKRVLQTNEIEYNNFKECFDTPQNRSKQKEKRINEYLTELSSMGIKSIGK